MTYNTRTTYTGNGTTQDFAIPFPYDVSSEVKVVRLDTGVSLPFTLPSTGICRLSSIPASGLQFSIYRDTDVTSGAVSWSVNTSLRSSLLNTMTTQFIRVMQEVKDAMTAALAAVNAQLAAYTVVTKTWSSTVAINWDEANCQRLTLTGTPTTLTFTGGVDGEKLVLELTQGSGGNKTVIFPANVRYSSSLQTISMSNTAQYTDKLGFMYNSSTNTYDFVAQMIGFH